MHILFLILLSLLTSCHREPVEVFIDAISPSQAASSIVGTPDPKAACPDIGQKLVIIWNLHRSCHHTSIKATIRFGNREEFISYIDLTQPFGLKIYELLNEEYRAKQGFRSYKVELIENGVVVKTVQHMLWCDLILLGPEKRDPLPDLDPDLPPDIEWLGP